MSSENLVGPWSLIHMRITCFEKLLDNHKQLFMNSNALSLAYDKRNTAEYQRLLGLSEILKKEYHDMYKKCEKDMEP